MPSADEIPAWLKLHRRLVDLQGGVGARNAIVCDLSGALLCYGLLRRSHGNVLPGLATLPGTEADEERELSALSEMFDRVLQARGPGNDKPGARFKVALGDEEPYVFAQSFAGVYVLLVSFNGPFTSFPVASKVRAALPAIEALTVMLPSPEGPDRGALSVRKRG